MAVCCSTPANRSLDMGFSMFCISSHPWDISGDATQKYAVWVSLKDWDPKSSESTQKDILYVYMIYIFSKKTHSSEVIVFMAYFIRDMFQAGKFYVGRRKLIKKIV